MRSVAADRGDVELVITAFFAIQDPERPQLGHPLLLQDDLERRLAMVLVRDAEGANFGSQSADLRRDLDQSFILLDQAVISALEALQIQPWSCENTCMRLISHLADVTSFGGAEAKKDRLLSFRFRYFQRRVARVTEATRVTRGASDSFFIPFFFSPVKMNSPISPTLSLEADSIRSESTVPR